MEEYLNQFTDWLLAAATDIQPEYFQLSTAGSEKLIYRERVYCYELYHQLRERVPEDFEFKISGELDKTNHPIIRRDFIPDFLVHYPGDMRNLLVVEVKPANADHNRMIKDLEKLTYFVSKLEEENKDARNYFAGYFWIYGLSFEEWALKRDSMLKVAGKQDINLKLITCFLHEQPNKRPVKVDWE